MSYLKQAQIETERKYSKHNIQSTIDRELEECDAMQYRMALGVRAMIDWLSGDYYESKNKRLDELGDTGLESIIQGIVRLICIQRKPITLSNMTGQLSYLMPHEDKLDRMKTIAELIAVCEASEIYEVYPDSRTGVALVKFNYVISERLETFLDQTKYLPPMVCEPNEIKGNSDSGHLTQAVSSVVLGKGNHHDYSLNLAHLNRMNQVPLSLDLALLGEIDRKVPDLSKEDLRVWKRQNKITADTYKELISHGNKFYMLHKYDKRGRCYAQGYHCTTQGDEFHKAVISLSNKEIIK